MIKKLESRLIFSPSYNANPERKSRLVGKMIEAAKTAETEERAAKIAHWQSVLVQGKCSIDIDTSTSAVIARNDNSMEADISELLTPGSRIVRTRHDGDTDWMVSQLVEPRHEGLPYRVQVRREDGALTNFSVNELMANPDESGRSWQIPVPIK